MAFWVCDWGHRNDDDAWAPDPPPIYWRKCSRCSPYIEVVYRIERDVAEDDPTRMWQP